MAGSAGRSFRPLRRSYWDVIFQAKPIYRRPIVDHARRTSSGGFHNKMAIRPRAFLAAEQLDSELH
jgi:hypothetical protein